MKEGPILFNGPMVRATLEGRKPQPQFEFHGVPFLRANDVGESPKTMCCPYGKPGDRLWVRETWSNGWISKPIKGDKLCYRATPLAEQGFKNCYRWRPSIHMPRWASRITLEIVSVRAERLNEISEADAIAEGAEFGFWYPNEGVFAEPTDEEDEQDSSFSEGFAFLWESINGPGSWDLNPWVWVIDFKVVVV